MDVQLGIGEQFVLIGAVSYVIFKLLPFYLAIALIFMAILGYIIYLYYDKTYFDRHGIPSQKPNLFMGNLLQLRHGRSLFMNKTNTFFKEVLGEILDQRRADKEAAEKYTDFFQLLLNALDEENSSQDENFSTEDSDIIHDQTENGGGKWKKSISRIEILAQSFVVLLAGYETTATTLHMIIYILAKLPEIQDRLRDEINNILEDREDIGYDDITKFQYMNQVIFETMRMYPAASRFSPEEKAKRDPLAFLPFGYGPRNCIGMRFAEFEIRATLAYMIKHYKFYPAPNSPNLPLEIDSRGLLKPKETLYVRAEKL
uniref:Cytochrome P450 n=1 Tax=Acrobeloides nanus TaxID=290746 RepID=A0A914E074_9BILA